MSGGEPASDRQAAARRARAEQAARAAAGRQPPPQPPPAVVDPLPYCIWATVALLAWILSPPVALAFFATLGAVRYVRAWRAGLRRSDCVLGDPRWVIAYLALAALAGVVWTARNGYLGFLAFRRWLGS
jgi:hypothetical protein